MSAGTTITIGVGVAALIYLLVLNDKQQGKTRDCQIALGIHKEWANPRMRSVPALAGYLGVSDAEVRRALRKEGFL